MRHAEETSGSFGYAEAAFGSSDYASPHQRPNASYAAEGLHATHQATSAGSFGPLFRELRRALGLTLPTAASFSGTRIDVIVALESGDFAGLPPWPETVRIVSQLTGLAQIDPRPVLGLIQQELSRVAVTEAIEAPQRSFVPVMGAPLPTMVQAWSGDGAEVRPVVPHNVAGARAEARQGRVPPPPIARVDEDGETVSDRSMALVRKAFAAFKTLPGKGRIIALSAVLIAAGGTIAQGSAIKASFATLHTPISRLLRGAENYLIWRSAPVKDGLRWINVDDPRSRRGDKLRVNRPSA